LPAVSIRRYALDHPSFAAGADETPALLKTRCLMPISQDLLEILVCPLCKEPVTLTPNNQGLKCSKCKRVYPIKDDIPVMLIDEAKIEE
jgi:uncharacterized protein